MGGAGYGNHGDEAEPKGGGGPGPGDAGAAGRALPPAGPHADESLINPDLTPGAGTLPDTSSGDGDVDPADA